MTWVCTSVRDLAKLLSSPVVPRVPHILPSIGIDPFLLVWVLLPLCQEAVP